ncbi:MAG: hypothetical protein JW850_17700 [Thermoflexales bacterium]|nr:hypothetical protein [Thermoflexales bacterium]
MRNIVSLTTAVFRQILPLGLALGVCCAVVQATAAGSEQGQLAAVLLEQPGSAREPDSARPSGAIVDSPSAANPDLTIRATVSYTIYLPFVTRRWPPMPPQLVMNAIDNPDYDGDYLLTWSAADFADYYVLQESETPDFVSSFTFAPQTSLSQTISDKSSGTHYRTYYYRARGVNTTPPGYDGAWSELVSTTVYALPLTPTLHSISNSEDLSSFVVSWDADAAADWYVLEQASTDTFTDSQEIYRGNALACTVGSLWPGVYYYRLASANPRASSAWSAWVSTTVTVIRDDFTNPATGWTVRRTSAPDPSVAVTRYVDGRLRTEVHSRWDYAIFSPMLEAPPPPYNIQMATRIVHFANLTSFGIVFGGNRGTTCPPIDRSSSADPNGCFFHYYRLNVIWGGYLKYQVKRIDYHEAEKGKARGVTLLGEGYRDISEITSDDNWNAWEIKVREDGFAVYVNNNLLGWTTDTTYLHDPLFGILTSTDEYNSAEFEHEFYYVDAAGDDPLPTSGYLLPGTNWYVPAD